MWKDLNLLSHFVLFSLHLTSILRLRVGWGSRVGQSRSGKPGGVGNPPSTSALREASRCCRCRCRLSEPRGARGARGGKHGKGPGSQRGLLVLTTDGRPSEPPGARGARGWTHGKGPGSQRGLVVPPLTPVRGTESERRDTGKGSRLSERPRTHCWPDARQRRPEHEERGAGHTESAPAAGDTFSVTAGLCHKGSTPSTQNEV